MGTILPCNTLADTFDVDMPLCITCSSCGNDLSKILSATVECEVGLANLEAELLQTHTVGGNNNSCMCIWHWLPCKPCWVIMNTVLLHKRMLTTRIKPEKSNRTNSLRIDVNCVPSIDWLKNFVSLKNAIKSKKNPFKEKCKSSAKTKPLQKKVLFELIRWCYHGRTRPSSR